MDPASIAALAAVASAIYAANRASQWGRVPELLVIKRNALAHEIAANPMVLSINPPSYPVVNTISKPAPEPVRNPWDAPAAYANFIERERFYNWERAATQTRDTGGPIILTNPNYHMTPIFFQF